MNRPGVRPTPNGFKLVVFGIGALGLVACGGGGGGGGDTPSNTISFAVPLSAEQSLNTSTSTASGTASITIDRDTLAVSGSVTAAGLLADITAAHIHTGFAGETGAPAIVFDGDSTDLTWNVRAGETLTADALAQLLRGGAYINVHTTAVAAGEIRGQIVPTGYRIESASLSEDEAWVAGQRDDRSDSGLEAEGFLTIETTTGAATAVLRFADATLPAAAHVHVEDGVNDPTALTLTAAGSADASAWRGAATLALADYTAGKLYFNVHLPAAGDIPDPGSIRAQIESQTTRVRTLNLTEQQAFLAGSRDAISNTAEGAGVFIINTVDGTADARLRVAGTTLNAAHLHRADTPGGRGAIAVGLSDRGDNIWTGTGTVVATEFQNAQLYFNAHSAAFGDGELRGQVDSESSAAVVVVPNAQEAADVPTNASGSSTGVAVAMLIVNTDTGAPNAWLRVEGTTNLVSGVRIEDSVGVMLDLSDTDAGDGKGIHAGSTLRGGLSLMTQSQLAEFEAGSLYFNILTLADDPNFGQGNPSGELRGQIVP